MTMLAMMMRVAFISQRRLIRNIIYWILQHIITLLSKRTSIEMNIIAENILHTILRKKLKKWNQRYIIITHAISSTPLHSTTVDVFYIIQIYEALL